LRRLHERRHPGLRWWCSRSTSPRRPGRVGRFGREGQHRRVMRDRGRDERFELLDDLVGDPAGPDAQGFADTFPEDVADTGFGLADPVAHAPRSKACSPSTIPTCDFADTRKHTRRGNNSPNWNGLLSRFLDIATHREPQRPTLCGQQRHLLGDRIARLAVGVFVSAPISSNSSNSNGCSGLIGTVRTRPANSVFRASIASDQLLQHRQGVSAGDGVAGEDPPPVGQFHALGSIPDTRTSPSRIAGAIDTSGHHITEFLPAPDDPTTRV